MIEINLLPGAKRKRGGKGLKLAMPDLKALITSVKDPWLIACVVAWVLVAGVAGPLWVKGRGQVAALGLRLAKVTADSQKYTGLVADRTRYEEARDSFRRQIELIKGIDRDRYVWPHILDEVAKALPPYAWLDQMQFRTGGAEADSLGVPALQVTGVTVDMQAFTRFMRNLEESPFIEAVSAVSTGTKVEQGQEVISFAINARYQVPDSALLTWEPLAASLVQGVRSGVSRRR